MSDIPDLPDDGEELDDFDAKLRLGEKVIEMAERLGPMLAISPTLRATYGFEMDGQSFKLTLEAASG
ncbi:MAG: hypothetical protein K2Q27_08350 [Novosphingobium sp.]|nr:hypothetical protein [Novosphingobium sp.]